MYVYICMGSIRVLMMELARGSRMKAEGRRGERYNSSMVQQWLIQIEGDISMDDIWKTCFHISSVTLILE